MAKPISEEKARIYEFLVKQGKLKPEDVPEKEPGILAKIIKRIGGK
ncbi:hypothetical protein SDC9_200855 [bioreactor metagenome]|uniref:Uncharacterized protein n=1 Tax=bioreactor metagenome TaxID=1076179 RepID=A0A645IPE6_9ZZZZ